MTAFSASSRSECICGCRLRGRRLASAYVVDHVTAREIGIGWTYARIYEGVQRGRHHEFRRSGGTFGIPHRLVGSSDRGSASWNTRRASGELKQ